MLQYRGSSHNTCTCVPTDVCVCARALCVRNYVSSWACMTDQFLFQVVWLWEDEEAGLSVAVAVSRVLQVTAVPVLILCLSLCYYLETSSL